ncbi:MAG: hypothetical protein IT243_05080 [Bacteroidia bacterium]|nr:hypothetical protein [Bacteroidia bacterium]
MKTKIILSILLLLASVTSFSQSRKYKKNQFDILKYSEELNLTNDQVESIKKIQSENFEKNKELISKNDKLKEEIKSNNIKMRDDIKSVLNAEQIDLLNKIKKDSATEMIKKKKEVANKIKDYREKNIKPVINVKRNDFENKLSSDEKRIIAECIAKHNALKKSKSEFSDKELLKERKQILYKETSLALEPIINNHKTELEKIYEELMPQMEKWHTDIAEIRRSSKKSEKQNQHKNNKKNKFAIRFLLNEIEQ